VTEGSEFFSAPPLPDQLSDPPQPRQQSINWTKQMDR